MTDRAMLFNHINDNVTALTIATTVKDLLAHAFYEKCCYATRGANDRALHCSLKRPGKGSDTAKKGGDANAMSRVARGSSGVIAKVRLYEEIMPAGMIVERCVEVFV